MASVPAKWRPTLGMITAAVIAGAVLLPLIGLVFFRLYENLLVRQTESELIAQAAVVRAVYAREIAAAPSGVFPVGAPEPPRDPLDSDPRYHPIPATLDLATAQILPPRPDPTAPSHARDDGALRIGQDLLTLTNDAQSTTLAGFRLLDADGVVIAGREEVGLSLASLIEVRTALAGHPLSTLRTRDLLHPPPPLYSISRGTRVRVFVAVPVFVDAHVRGVVLLSRTPDNILRNLYAERVRLFWAGLLILIGAALIGAVFVRTITRPLHALANRAEAITQGDRAAIRALDHHGTQEVARLTDSFMLMAKRLSERSDYLSTFANHVTHELKTPLTAIKGAAELMHSTEMNDAERERFLANILADSARMSALLDALRELARADNPNLGGEASLDALCDALRQRFPALTISADANPTLPLSLDNALIVFANLAANAGHHGATTLIINVQDQPTRRILRIADNGAGISVGNRERIFEPFFTTRRETGGAGMGLGIARALLRAHGGDITLASSEQGAAFDVTFPLTPPRPSRWSSAWWRDLFGLKDGG